MWQTMSTESLVMEKIKLCNDKEGLTIIGTAESAKTERVSN